MKKTSILIALMTSGLMAFSQAPVRMSLYEEFTGENCGPCAAANPALNTLLANNASKVIALKWEVPIPSAPSNTWSLYRTNEAEINWRYRSTNAGGYGYPAQYSPTNTAVSGINSAPTGLLDGKHCWQFGATSDHPNNLNATVINSAQVQPTNFSIAMTTSWSPTFTNCVVDVTLTSSASFTSTGTLRFRCCLVERSISFQTPPGTTQEKDFKDVVRKSYPTTMSGTVVTGMGTAISNTWTAGMTQTLQLICNIPNYIVDYGQMAFVGFIQDDVPGVVNKPVYQAFRTAQPSIPNEAKAVAVAFGNTLACTPTIAPVASIMNNGNNAITAMTITPYMNGTPGTPVTWTGNLAPTATTTVNMGVENTTNGSNTYSFTITGVSGGDVVMSNNSASSTMFNTNSYVAGVVNEGFVAPAFPPAGWFTHNPTTSPWPWQRSTQAGGFQLSSESSRIFINWTPAGQSQYMYMPGANLTGTANPTIKFDLSYTRLNNNSTDQLAVEVSTDCGQSWNAVWQNSGATMSTTPNNSVSLNVPSSASHWSLVTAPLTGYANNPGVLIRFRATGGGGNVIWVDNINLLDQAPSGLSHNTNNVMALDVYPNPAKESATLYINTHEAGAVNVTMVNALGQTVYSSKHNVTSGTNNITLDAKNLPGGVYLINVESAEKTLVKKLIIQN